jgi:hypothetical protein
MLDTTSKLCHYVLGLAWEPLLGELKKTEVFGKRIMRMADFGLNMG